MKIFSGSSNQDLAQKMAEKLGLTMGSVEIGTFANGEKRVWVRESVKGENVILVQSFSRPTDEYIIEFLLLSDALERAGARHINVVIPWLGYSLQDKIFRDGEPIAAKVIANLVSNSYVKRAFLLDLHNSSTPGFFSIPIQHLSAADLFVEYAKKEFDLNNYIVASPDFGGLKRARSFAEKLQLDLINIDKNRDLHSGVIKAMNLNGEVGGKSVLIFDDLINSGSTIISAAEVLKQSGAKQVHFLSTHGMFAKGYDSIVESKIDSVVVTNSIDQKMNHPKIKVIDASGIFADALLIWAKT